MLKFIANEDTAKKINRGKVIFQDRIHWNGRTRRVVRIRNRQNFGYYQAYAVRSEEDRNV